MGEWFDNLTIFLQFLAAAGFPATTITLRRQQLAHMGRGLGYPPGEVTADKLVSWFGEQCWAPETRRSYRAAARRFFSWLHDAGRIPHNPAAGLPACPETVGTPRPASDQAWQQALNQADDRTRLMLRLSAQLGLRRGEVARLHSDDVDVDRLVLRVHGKGDKTRTVPLPTDLAGRIRHCDGWVFPSRRGGHLKPQTVGMMVSDVLPEGVTMHALRHRFASRAYRGTRNLRAVQAILGHTSIATTQRYLATDDDEIRQTMLAAR